MVDSCIHHNSAHPPHEHYFGAFIRIGVELIEVAEDFYKTVVHNIYSLIVAVNVAENDFEAVSIKTFIEDLLIPMVIEDAAVKNCLQKFQP